MRPKMGEKKHIEPKINTKGGTQGVAIERTLNEILKSTTEIYLSHTGTTTPTPAEVEAQLLEDVRKAVDVENSLREKADKLRKPTTLTFSQIAQILSAFHPICRISAAGENADTDNDLLAIYQTDGDDEGIYVTSEEVFRKLARQYNYSLTKREFEEILLVLRDLAPRKERCKNKNWIAVNNGIFDYDSKTLLPFTPDTVFISKSRVDYQPAPANPVFTNPDGSLWDVESWMNELSDDPDVVNLLWEILGAIIRPHVHWNKSAWFYSETGNNGKGTLCALMRNLCGKNSYASIPIADFGKEFLLEPLTRASAVIVDENDVGTFVDKAANLKAIITNDVIQINRKFKTPIAYQFYGFMVQCLNEFPKIKDKSDSFYRRQLFIPFEKSFTGRENKAIKGTYLADQSVLEYVLHRVLHMNYYSLSEPETCRLALEEYKEHNDPVRLFAEEIITECVWDLLPFNFLYDLYKAWFKEISPSGKVLAQQNFTNDIINVLSSSTEWETPGKRTKIRPSTRMDDPEPLISRYQLTNWMNARYKGNDQNLINTPILAAGYRGFLRTTSSATDEDDD